MSDAQHGERGGGMHASPLSADFDNDAIGAMTDLHSFHTSSSPRHVRFPQGHRDDVSGTSSAVQSLTSASTLDSSKLDLSPSDSVAREGVLRDTFFPRLHNDAAAHLDDPDEMQKKDPIGTQIWKLYNKQKSQLPNSERMENLTWRMMSMNLRKMRRQSAHGIAQLRSLSQDKQAHHDLEGSRAEPMNLDDFIVPSSVASPAGVPDSPSASDDQPSSKNATAPAIPIRKQSQLNDQTLHISRASAPSVQPAVKRENEFGIMIPHDPEDQGFHDYSLDQPHPPHFQQQQHSNSSQIPFNLHTFDIDNDPIINSAGPFQNQFNFSPIGSPMAANQGNHYSSMFNNAHSMASSLNSTDFYNSPPGSAYPSTVSTPQPIPEGEQIFFGDRSGMEIRGRMGSFNPPHNNLSSSMQPFMFNPTAGDSLFNNVSAAGPPPPFSAHSYHQSNHVDPNQIVHPNFSHPGRSELTPMTMKMRVLHGVVRPLSLKTDVIKKRNRGSGNSVPVSTSSRSKNKTSRKNSIAAQSTATTPNSTKASGAESESPKSITGSASNNAASSTAANTASNVSTTASKNGVVPIAPGPPKPQSQNLAASAPARNSAVAPKRLRSAKAGNQDTEMGDADDTTGKSLPSTSSNQKKNEPKPLVQAPPSMATQHNPIQMGSMGQGAIPGSGSGPQEWEWLTMSL
ncbi:putative gata transcriptional activator [Diplodia seriata]|uniref:Putative gata transcriptional activator n=1 Tax=Diplodia seriata TaxID=420778 RepID=A0A0G2EJR2_9PEZI|nr:putative gata transcriptional activator [Diplodia seriata]